MDIDKYSYIFFLHKMEYTILQPQTAISPHKNAINYCYEIFSPLDVKIPPLASKLIYSGINLNCLLNDFYVILESKPDEEDYVDILGGIIDKDYQGDVGIIMHNFSNLKEKMIKRGDVIAVARLLKYSSSSSSSSDIFFNANKDGGDGNDDDLSPKKMTKGSVAWDIYTPQAGIINENDIFHISTGIHLSSSSSSSSNNIRYASRSGLASKSSVIVIYGDEKGDFILQNLSNRKYNIQKGHRICQIIYEME